jgi:hypothetical protein
MLNWEALIQPITLAESRPPADGPEAPQPIDLDDSSLVGGEYARTFNLLHRLLHTHALIKRRSPLDRPPYAQPWAHDLNALAELVRQTPSRYQSGFLCCCLMCKHHGMPGLSFPGYCAKRLDLPTQLGENHPLRMLPNTAGLDCNFFEPNLLLSPMS